MHAVILEDADLRQIMVARGTEQMGRFDWGRILAQLVAVLERFADGNALNRGRESCAQPGRGVQ
jgi:hypothetical protein